jgi:nicotinate phosphoribosyltransferase
MNQHVSPLSQIYRTSLALLTDLYQLTMAYAHWKAGTADKEGVFNLFFRKNPFEGGFSIACGLTHTIDYISQLQRPGFEDGDLAFLATLTGNDGQPLFEENFLEYLRDMRFQCDVDAVPEGTVIFPHEPMYRVRGPIIQATLVETPFLTLNGFPTLVATKAARVKLAARGEPLLDFGLRRAQGIDGSLMASWAAYVGGADATSNVLAARLFGIPCKGTHAHSWVMSFDDEFEAFMAYARALPNNCVFLVDTYDTIEGVKKAIEVGKWLRSKGYKMVGVRLDSGDLAYLSKQARKLLDKEGFGDARVFASNDLDETVIASLKQQGAKIAVWGVGTKLVTAYDQPAMGVVYKLAAWRRPGQAWHHCVKLSEQAIKVSNPGIQQVRRFLKRGKFECDMIYNIEAPPAGRSVMIDPMDMTRRKTIGKGLAYLDLLVPVARGSEIVYSCPSLPEVRAYAQQQLAGFHEGIKRQLNPHQYPVGLEQGLAELKTELILKARAQRDRAQGERS